MNAEARAPRNKSLRAIEIDIFKNNTGLSGQNKRFTILVEEENIRFRRPNRICINAGATRGKVKKGIGNCAKNVLPFVTLRGYREVPERAQVVGFLEDH